MHIHTYFSSSKLCKSENTKSNVCTLGILSKPPIKYSKAKSDNISETENKHKLYSVDGAEAMSCFRETRGHLKHDR